MKTYEKVEVYLYAFLTLALSFMPWPLHS